MSDASKESVAQMESTSFELLYPNFICLDVVKTLKKNFIFHQRLLVWIGIIEDLFRVSEWLRGTEDIKFKGNSIQCNISWLRLEKLFHI